MGGFDLSSAILMIQISCLSANNHLLSTFGDKTTNSQTSVPKDALWF